MSRDTPASSRVDQNRHYQALVLGRAGLDLYPEPDGRKARDASTFSADLGGSAGNIAVAMANAGATVGLISGLSGDAVGDFVRNQLSSAGIDMQLITTTGNNERTSLAIAEVRNTDCEVVIYRNDPADLAFQVNDQTIDAIAHADNLVVTGTCLIAEPSRRHTLLLMQEARQQNSRVWLDLDYRSWNWPNRETTRSAYTEAAAHADILVGNEEEFAVLTDNLESYAVSCNQADRVLIVKRGADGSSLFTNNRRLDSGTYPVQALKPYGSGDAFLGNLIVALAKHQDWQKAIDTGSAAAAIVVTTRGCASAMPYPEQITALQQDLTLSPASIWR